MTTGRLNGRLSKLEAMLKPATDNCGDCELRHVQPLTMDLTRRIIGAVSVSFTATMSAAAANLTPKLCLCESCCGDPRDRELARMSHKMDIPPEAAQTARAVDR